MSSTRTARYAGIWNGGANYSDSSELADVELFDSIQDAADTMRDRRDHGHRQPQTFRYVFREIEHVFTPCAHDENSGDVRLFRIDGMEPDDYLAALEHALADGAGCDVRLGFGPRGGIIRA